MYQLIHSVFKFDTNLYSPPLMSLSERLPSQIMSLNERLNSGNNAQVYDLMNADAENHK